MPFILAWTAFPLLSIHNVILYYNTNYHHHIPITISYPPTNPPDKQKRSRTKNIRLQTTIGYYKQLQVTTTYSIKALHSIEVIPMCKESEQNNTADTPDNKNSEENAISSNMTEEEKKRRLNERASEYFMFLD